MTDAFNLIVAALRDRPEGWEDIVREQFYCTLPGEWPLIAILSKGYDAADDLEGSEGGNGAADAGKAALFSASGGLRGETLTSDDYVLIGTGSGIDGSILLVNDANATANIKSSNLTAEREFQFPDQAGTLALTTDLPGAASETQAGIVERATDAETVTGTDTTRYVSPASLTVKMSAPGAIGNTTPGSGAFTTLSTTGTLTLGTTNGQLTGGAGNMTITAGSGNSRTLTLQTTTSGGTATNAIVISATQRVTISSNEAANSSSSGCLVLNGGMGALGSINSSSNVIGQNMVLGGYVGAVSGGGVQLIGSSAGAAATRVTFDFAPSSSTMGIGIGASAITIYRGDGSAGGTFNVTGTLNAASAVATPAAGSTSARLLFGTTAGFGIYYGSGAPTVSAAQGSIYLRSDGSGTADRLYVNTNGTTGWTNFTSAT